MVYQANKIKSYAKVNLFLKVAKKIGNYHKLYSLVTQVNLFDEILIRENVSKRDNLYVSGKFDVKKKNNIILNLLKSLRKEFSFLKSKNFDIFIKKNVPVGSGLGGASSNATSVFIYLKKKYNLKISKKKSIKLLANIGKDCPLFLSKKVKLIKSSGEYYTEFKNKPKLQMLLIYPMYELSTKKVFNNLRKISYISYKKSINLNKKQKLLETCKFYGNDLQHSALKIAPKLKTLIKLISKIHYINFYSMTGSGSAFFVISNKKKLLSNAQKMIKKQRSSFWTKIVKTV